MGKLMVSGIAVVAAAMAAGGFAFWRSPLAVIAWFNRLALSASGLQKIGLQTAGGPQTYWRGGAGPVVMMLHGAGDQAGTWAKVAPRFMGSYRVLLPDLAGHGESAPATGGIGFPTLLDGVDAVLAAESPDKPVVLVGNSLGAWLALWYAAEHPKRVARVVAVNGGAVRNDSGTPVTLMPSTRAEARRLFDLVQDPRSRRAPGFFLDDVIRRSHRGPIARLAQAWAEADHYLLDDRLDQITVPVDLVWGESDGLLPLAYARELAARLPAARLTLIPRCGHVPQQECPVEFRGALQNLLAAAPPTVNVAHNIAAS